MTECTVPKLAMVVQIGRRPFRVEKAKRLYDCRTFPDMKMKAPYTTTKMTTRTRFVSIDLVAARISA